MEWSILFVGPVGAGKTQLIRTISDIEVLATEETPTDATAAWKASTTVAMDVGAMSLGGADHVRLYGAPGQMRFRFMWDVLLEQAKAVVVLVDHSSPDSCADLVEHLRALRQRMAGERRPVVVAVTHADLLLYCGRLREAEEVLGRLATARLNPALRSYLHEQYNYTVGTLPSRHTS